jgi:hypothetical protein
MNEEAIIPDWLHDIFLGYGDPAAAQWFNLPGQLRTVDFKDTFLDVGHVREAFPQYQVRAGGRGEAQGQLLLLLLCRRGRGPAPGSAWGGQLVARAPPAASLPMDRGYRGSAGHAAPRRRVPATRALAPDLGGNLPAAAPPTLQVELVNRSAGGAPLPPFRITFPEEDPTIGGAAAAASKAPEAAAEAGGAEGACGWRRPALPCPARWRPAARCSPLLRTAAQPDTRSPSPVSGPPPHHPT